MKIVYQNVIWLLVFVAYNYNSLANDEEPEGEDPKQDSVEMDIAAFFDEEDPQTKLAFETAVSNANIMQGKIKYNAITRVISGSDSFEISETLCDMTANAKIGVVFCPTSPKAAAIIESISVNMEIPVVHIDWRSATNYTENAERTLAINFYPYRSLLYQGLGVIVRNLQWRSIVIFYESVGSLIRLQDILKLQNFDGTAKHNSIIVKELGPGPDYRSALKQIQNKSEHRIIVDCKTSNIMSVLQQAKDLNLLEKHFSYFLTSLDAHTLDLASLETQANITTVRIIDPESSNIKLAVKNWKNYMEQNHNTSVHLDPYSIKTEAALMSDAVTTFLSATQHLAHTVNIEPRNLFCHKRVSWENGLQVALFLREDKMVDTKAILTSPIGFSAGRRTDFNISVVEGNRGEVIATWNPNNPQKLQFSKTEADRNKELVERWRRKGTVRVASIIGEPYLMHQRAPDGTILDDKFEGFSKELMDKLGKKLNITFEFYVLSGPFRGSYDKNTKSWNGLIGEILSGRAEFAICDLTITPERREVVDFSTPFMRLGISILYKKPEPKEADMYAFLEPLDFALWMYSATLYLGLSVVLYFIARLSPQDWENPHPCDPEPEELENIWNMKNCLWLTLGSIMNQGCDILPKGICSRLVASMWWFFAIIVTNSYMANLAAFLTKERSANDIESAEDLAKQTKVKYGTLQEGSTRDFFRDSNYSTYQRMWTSMQQSKPSVFEKDNAAGVARVLKAKNRLYAFLMESATLEYQLEKHCELMQVGSWLDSKSYGIAMPLDYPYRSNINEALLNLQEKGEITALKEKWWSRAGNGSTCPTESEEDTSNKLALENVGGVFVVLAVGVGLAYVTAIFEFLWNVRNVSVEEHMSFWQAFKIEAKFALNVTVTKKKVKRQASVPSRSRSRSVESRGLTRSILQGAGSLLRLDVLGRLDTPGATSRHSSRPLN